MNDPYSRVYWSVMDDPKFDTIREDVALFGAWSVMLIVADMSWPVSAFVPPMVPPEAVAELSRCGLIDVLPGRRYRVHGLASEREKRSHSARNAAAVRWHSNGTPPPDADPMLDETRRVQDETSIAPAREGLPNLDSTVARIWEETTGRSVLASGAYVAEYLDEACRRHKSPSKVGSAIYRARKTFDHIPDGPSMVAAMRPILDPFPDPKATAKAERERELAAASRRGTAATLRNNHETGFHTDKPEPRCPACQEVMA